MTDDAPPLRIIDPSMPFLATVCSPAAMTPVFNNHVLPLVYPGEVTDEVTIESVSYSPGTKCIVLYSIRTVPAVEARPRWALATFGADHESVDDGADPPGSVPLPEYGGRIEFFPMDGGLPTLPSAVSPNEIGALLVELGLANATRSPERAARVSVDVLRYTPGTRCVVRYSVDDPSDAASTELIGKVYRSQKRAVAAWRAHSLLHANASSAVLRFPKPLALVGDRCLVLMEKVAGDCLRDRLLADDGPVADGLVLKAASALVTLHAVQLDSHSQPAVSIGNEVAAVAKHVERLEAVAPDLARRAAHLLGEIADALRSCTTGPPTLLHGDFTPSQLILDAGPITIVDFDRIGFGDPVIDIGTFMAKLVRDAVLSDRSHLRGLPTRFLETYAAGATDEVVERATVMQSLVLTRVALSRFRQNPAAREHRRRSSSASSRASSDDAVEHLLDEAATCLATR